MADTRESSLTSNVTRFADVGIAFLIILIVGMMIIPMPTFLLDILLAMNITFGVIVLLATFYVLKPLEIPAFPTILLIATLYRLALNVSTTRLILLQAYAGEVIAAFGNFVVGGNYVVGGVVFLILVIIQFVVITRGAERVAEVAARFTLDAMPGKQMAIDADLNAGLIDEGEARRRRSEIQREADFYGSMDGASKFVRGDAIAGLIITAVNILGGLTIGVFQRGFTFQQALQTYSLLTVGDGLVAQIPALLLSTATGVIVTRAAGESNLGHDIVTSLTSNCRPLFIGAGLLFVMAVIPGLPTVPFFLLGAILAFAGFVVYREGKAPPREPAEEKRSPTDKASAGAPENVLPLVAVDPMEVEIGYALIPLVDPSQGGDMLERIATIRRQMAMERGLIVPPIRIRDNIQLKPTEYLIRIKGAQVARAEVMPDHYLAMNTSGTEEPLVGIPTKEPAFGLEGYWIAPELRDQAESLGYTVVDAPSVLATHISEIVKKYGAELLTRQEVQKLVNLVKESNPAVTDELMNVLSLGDVQKVLQNLLKESVPIRDLVTIFETLADLGRVSRNPDFLTERAREALFRHITLSLQDSQGAVTVLTLSPRWEQRVKESIQGDLASGWRLNMPIDEIQKLIKAVGDKMEKAATAGHAPALLVHPDVRLVIRRLLEGSLPQIPVISYNEITPGTELRSLGMVE